MARDKEQYSKTREDFDGMSLEDRASFLIEATFSTAAEAIDRAGKRLADLAEEMEEKSKRRKQEASDTDTDSSAENRPEDTSNE